LQAEEAMKKSDDYKKEVKILKGAKAKIKSAAVPVESGGKSSNHNGKFWWEIVAVLCLYGI
jgi:hypothetical protein